MKKKKKTMLSTCVTCVFVNRFKYRFDVHGSKIVRAVFQHFLVKTVAFTKIDERSILFFLILCGLFVPLTVLSTLSSDLRSYFTD